MSIKTGAHTHINTHTHIVTAEAFVVHLMMYYIVMVSCHKKLFFVFLHWEGTGTYKSRQTPYHRSGTPPRRKREGALVF